MKKTTRFIPHLIAVGAVMLFVACGNDNGDSGDGGTNPCTIEANYASIHNVMLSQPRCATAVCHDVQSKAGNLDFKLGADAVHAALIGTASFNANATKPMVISAGSAADSWFFVKVSEATPPGGRMPLGGALSQCDIDMIKTWIDNGATK